MCLKSAVLWQNMTTYTAKIYNKHPSDPCVNSVYYMLTEDELTVSVLDYKA